MRHLLLGVLFTLASALQVHATHLFGGEIRYGYAATLPGGFLYEIQVDLYTDPVAPADVPWILVSIDGAIDTISTSNIIFLPGLCPDAERKIYLFTHLFPGPGTYPISAEIPNRHSGILNIPNSSDEAMGLVATIIIDASGYNSSPRFNAPQPELSYGWSWLLHDPQATDPDGDSLSFEATVPLGTGLTPIPGYLDPAATTPPGDLTWTDPATGVFLWDQPNTLGYYQIAIKCTEWRNGVAIGSVTRDMMLCVSQLPTGIEQAGAEASPWLLSEGTIGRYRIDPALADGLVTVLDASGRAVLQRPARGTIELSTATDGIYVILLRSAHGPVRSARVAMVR